MSAALSRNPIRRSYYSMLAERNFKPSLDEWMAGWLAGIDGY